MDNYHTPVLLKESVDGLDINPSGIYADLTFGGGGHSREILARLNNKGKLFGFDQDADAAKNAIEDKRFIFVRSNFCFTQNFIRYYGIDKLDGILADLGVSSHHFDKPERGFSFRFGGILDMRMNQNSELTAKDILNSYDEEKLSDVFFYYGELPNARRIARTIVEQRKVKEFGDIQSFIEVLQPLIGNEHEKKALAKIFQALRIEVNDEMSSLKKMLLSTSKVLKENGRISIITYHSLEDRLVKNYMKTGNFEGKVEKDFFGNTCPPFKLITNKITTPNEEEVTKNPRSRSAKLRVASRTSF